VLPEAAYDIERGNRVTALAGIAYATALVRDCRRHVAQWRGIPQQVNRLKRQLGALAAAVERGEGEAGHARQAAYRADRLSGLLREHAVADRR
jgi:hypothetical protein